MTARNAAPGAGPGFQRRRIGDVVVTAILDGSVAIPLEALTDISIDEARRLQDCDGRPYPCRSPMSFFAVSAGESTILIDAGGDDDLDPGLGKGFDRLAAAGIDPDRVAAVLMTHLHTDHYGGLVRPDGRAAFPKAELVLHAAEYQHRFGGPGASPRTVPPDYLAAAVDPYRDRLRLVAGGDTVAGIEAVHLPGHTPGHTGWRICSGGETLLIWGDVVHLPSIQFAHPATSLSYDIDPGKAAESRAATFREAAAAGYLVAGMHLDFPCFGTVAKEDGAYRWQA